MERLWSPWREQYILGIRDESKGGCIFCNLGKQNPAKENLVIFKGKLAFVVMNKYPYNNGHLMVIPYNHTDDITNLTQEERNELIDLTNKSVIILKELLEPQGFNIGANQGDISGAGIAEHIHFHIVPRWGGDTNFMPVIGETKIISQALEKSWEAIKKLFDNKFKK